MQDSELAQIETLMAADKNITSLEGLEKMLTLKKADLSNNKIETATIRNSTLEELNLVVTSSLSSIYLVLQG